MKLFLDSGAHSIFQWLIKEKKEYKRNSPTLKTDYTYVESDEFWEYIDNYGKFIQEHKDKFSVCVNVDVFGKNELSWKIQKYLEDTYKAKIIPVFHFMEDVKWLKKMMENYEYIGIGGMGDPEVVTKNTYLRWADSVFKIVCQNKKRPEWKTHGFAMTSVDLLFRYPWFSTDSTSWMMFSQFGAILLPKIIDGEERYDMTPQIFFLSIRSKKKDKVGDHFDTLSKMEKNRIISFFNREGFELGESTWDGKKETVIKEGLKNNHHMRDHWNFLYYLKVQDKVREKDIQFTTQPSFFSKKQEDIIIKPKPIIEDDGDQYRIWFAGGMPMFIYRDREEDMKRVVESKGYTYRRLVSFYYHPLKREKNLLDIKQEELDEVNKNA